MNFRICVSILLLLITSSLVNPQDSTEEKDKDLLIPHGWIKGVIKNSKLHSLLPSKISYLKKVAERSFKLIEFSRPKLFVYNKTDVSSQDLKYDVIPIRQTVEMLPFLRAREQWPILFDYCTDYLPTCWDMSNTDNIVSNNIYNHSNGVMVSIEQLQVSKRWNRDIPTYSIWRKNENSITYELYNHYTFKNLRRVESADGKITFEKIPPVKENGVMLNVIAYDDKITDVFLLNSNQVLVWNTKIDRNSTDIQSLWKFKYTFKIPRSCHFEVCRIGNDLYFLSKKYGIYKLDIFDAEKKAPEPPNVITKNRYGQTHFMWDGFQDPNIVKNDVKAYKISDLNYERYIVDKDQKTAYVVSDGYLYELYNLKIRSQIPEVPETDNFLDNEAEYMRAVLKAIYNLGATPEKTPAQLLKVTSESEVDKILAEENAKNTFETKDSENVQNNDLPQESDENTNVKSENPETLGEADTNNNMLSDGSENDTESINNNDLNNDPESNEHTNISNDSDIVMYVGIALSFIVILTLIFIVLARRKR